MGRETSAGWARLSLRPGGVVRLTNEVQHLVKVLPCEERITNSPLKSGVKWPDYKARDTASAKSRQVWIARHLPSLGS